MESPSNHDAGALASVPFIGSSRSRHAPVRFLSLTAWLEAANTCGFVLEPLLDRVGIAVDLVHVENTRVEQDRIANLMVACVEAADRVGRAHFPFALGAAPQNFDYLPELLTFLRTSGSAREALRAFHWAVALINPRLEVRLEETAEHAWLRFRYAGPIDAAHERYFSESTLAVIHSTARRCLGSSFAVERIACRHSAPRYAASFHAQFAAEVTFDAPEYGLAYARAVLDAPLEGNHPVLHHQVEMRLSQRFDSDAAPSGVVARIERAFAADPSLLGLGIEHMARRFALHPRTLQRRLREQQVSFLELQTRVRMQLASAWLREGTFSIESIGDRLGFADRRCFSRAFSRWAGMTPSAFRERARDAAA